jgi:hypothetical protein
MGNDVENKSTRVKLNEKIGGEKTHWGSGKHEIRKSNKINNPHTP